MEKGIFFSFLFSIIYTLIYLNFESFLIFSFKEEYKLKDSIIFIVLFNFISFLIVNIFILITLNNFNCLNFFTNAISVIIAYLFCALILKIIMINYDKIKNDSKIFRDDAIGRVANIKEEIRSNTCGLITYQLKNEIISVLAKNELGENLKKGTRVKISKVKKSIYYVTLL